MNGSNFSCKRIRSICSFKSLAKLTHVALLSVLQLFVAVTECLCASPVKYLGDVLKCDRSTPSNVRKGNNLTQKNSKRYSMIPIGTKYIDKVRCWGICVGDQWFVRFLLPAMMVKEVGGMTQEEKLSMSFVLELKRLWCMRLCNEISVEVFRVERDALFGRFRAQSSGMVASVRSLLSATPSVVGGL